MIKMTMPAMASFEQLLGVPMTKFGKNLDLMLESWSVIASGKVGSEDILIYDVRTENALCTSEEIFLTRDNCSNK